MKYLNLEEPDITLTAIVNEIAVNQSEVIITRNGLRVAHIVPYSIPDVREKNYPLRGIPINIAADFDEVVVHSND